MESDKSILTELLTIRDWLRFAASEFERARLFYGHGTDNAWDEAAALLLAVIKLPMEKLAQAADARLSSAEKELALTWIRTRIESRKPLPYLTGEAFFAGLRFEVNEQVLIPRSPIAELIASGFQPWLTQEPQRILDLCTGSGCIGIACATVFPEAEVELSDISPDALLIAQRNIEQYQLRDRVTAIESDLFAHLQGRYDLIVSNPPYVDAGEMDSLPIEFHSEPKLALASGVDGLDFTRRLLAQVDDFLAEGGLLVVEVGNSWPALEQAYPEVAFTWIEFEHGGHGVFAFTKQQLADCKQFLS